MSVSPLTRSSPPSPNSPISPKSIPTADGYFNPSRPENPRLESITEHVKADHRHHPRNLSTASIQFKATSETPRPSVDGAVKPRLSSSIRDVSPPPASRFQSHVSFDNFAEKEPTNKNTVSLTLNVSHKGYVRRRRSRTFMVGVDGNDYSDIALQWMLDELIDDGDHIVCLKVVEKDAKIARDSKTANDSVQEENKNAEKKRKEFLREGSELIRHIKIRNDANRAILITVELSVGKVSETFASMIALYEPSMLIVGTRGRSLGGMKGLVQNRNSFSKWCLQHSPVPVVVVRPTEKRTKKKTKRDADPQRGNYIRLLRESGVQTHEIAAGAKNSNFEIANDRDTEAHAVAAALGLPARFDPTLKPLHWASERTRQEILAKSAAFATVTDLTPDSRSASPGEELKSQKLPRLDSPAISGEEAEESEDEYEEEGEFEAVPGHTLLADNDWDEKQEKLHDMEQGEAGALILGRKGSVSSAGSSASVAGGAPIFDKQEIGEVGEMGEGVKADGEPTCEGDRAAEETKKEEDKEEEKDLPEIIKPTAPIPE